MFGPGSSMPPEALIVRDVTEQARAPLEFPRPSRPQCPDCNGDGWTFGWGPGPCYACAEAENMKRVPY